MPTARRDEVPAVYSRKADLLARSVDGELVILDSAGAKVHQLNATAGCIWNACDGTRSAPAIAALVAEEFDADIGTILPDVERTLMELHQQGLLVVRGATTRESDAGS